jgi:hypothetical protein
LNRKSDRHSIADRAATKPASENRFPADSEVPLKQIAVEAEQSIG